MTRRSISNGRRAAIAVAVLALRFAEQASAQAPVSYRVSFPEAQHHRMQVEAVFADVPPGTLEISMARTSPGRYAVHEFAKNVYDVQIDDGSGAALAYERPDPGRWHVTDHKGKVRVRYRVFGNRLDGTFLSIDATHGHLNIPASLLWARGFESRPATVTFEAPAQWKIATQLKPTQDARTYTAANLQYLMDSPVELSEFTLRTFNVDGEFRVALHHDGSESDADRFASGVEKLVREARAVFGEFPAFETPYTFIADYLPWASFDGMEHRNSTILTSSARIRDPEQHLDLLGTAAHEFFHAWNVERIRPRSLEPFRFDAPNPSGELWFAEGFTQYYGPLLMRRAGHWSVDRFAGRIGAMIDAVSRTPARKYRSAEEVSLMAQYVDQSAWLDQTNFENHFVSYYEWGAAIALALDLSLRARSHQLVGLDHYMRRLWQEFGRPPAAADGLVSRPYTMRDLQDVLADVSGDRAFADEFFRRYIQGREIADYQTLLAKAGFVLQKRNPGRPWLGPVALEFAGGAARVSRPTIEGTPAYEAGLDRDDEIVAIDGVQVASGNGVEEAVQRRRPGERVRLTIRRRGATEELTATLIEDPRSNVLPAESTGRQLTPIERAFRQAWLESRQ